MDDTYSKEPFNVSEPLSLVGKNWGWVLATGIAYVVLGLVAYSWPVASTVALTVMLGTLLVVSGVIQALHAIQLRKYSGAGWRILQSVVALGAGVLILRFPAGGMLAVAIALSLFLFVGATAKWILAAGMRPVRGWGWMFLSSLVSLVLAVYIVATFPVSALWVPGALLGIDLAFTGISLIGFAFNLRHVYKEAKTYGRPPQLKKVA